MKKRYVVAATAGAWVIARVTSTGRHIAIEDHPSRASAEAEAARLNRLIDFAEAARLHHSERIAEAVSSRLRRLAVRMVGNEPSAA